MAMSFQQLCGGDTAGLWGYWGLSSEQCGHNQSMSCLYSQHKVKQILVLGGSYSSKAAFCYQVPTQYIVFVKVGLN